MILNLISFFSGFLTSSIVDTSLGEFSEWAVVGSSLVLMHYQEAIKEEISNMTGDLKNGNYPFKKKTMKMNFY